MPWGARAMQSSESCGACETVSGYGRRVSKGNRRYLGRRVYVSRYGRPDKEVPGTSGFRWKKFRRKKSNPFFFSPIEQLPWPSKVAGPIHYTRCAENDGRRRPRQLSPAADICSRPGTYKYRLRVLDTFATRYVPRCCCCCCRRR